MKSNANGQSATIFQDQGKSLLSLFFVWQDKLFQEAIDSKVLPRI